MAISNQEQPVAVQSVAEFFMESVQAAIEHQHVDAAEDTVYYLVSLLERYTRSERWFDTSNGGVGIKPLALLYLDAAESPSSEARRRALRKLGDLALLVSGMFSASLNRRVVDIDYYIAMGGNAYNALSRSVQRERGGRVLGEVYDELGEKFARFVDVLGEVGERAGIASDCDIMRWYELWIRTGSERAAARLRCMGIQPAPASVSKRFN